MPSTMPLRVGDDLLASAKLAADASGRSAAQQIGYWARLGRELERSGSVSVREMAEVLAGSRSYDDLDPKAQATVRAEWDARIEARREALNLADRFAAEGRSWVEASPDGTIVRRPAGERSRRRRPAAAATNDAQPRTTSRSTGEPGSKKGQAARGVAATRATERTATKTTAAAKQSRVKKAAAERPSARSR